MNKLKKKKKKLGRLPAQFFFFFFFQRWRTLDELLSDVLRIRLRARQGACEDDMAGDVVERVIMENAVSGHTWRLCSTFFTTFHADHHADHGVVSDDNADDHADYDADYDANDYADDQADDDADDQADDHADDHAGHDADDHADDDADDDADDEANDDADASLLATRASALGVGYHHVNTSALSQSGVVTPGFFGRFWGWFFPSSSPNQSAC